MTIPSGISLTPRRVRPDLPPVGLRLAAGVTAVVVAAVVASVVPGTFGVIRVALVIVAVAGFATAVDDWRAAASTAAIAFLVVNGFLVDRYGQLAWHGSADVLRVLALLGAAVLGTSVGRGCRVGHARRSTDVKRGMEGGARSPS
jgi:hypothetical protein